jgi:methionyl-tRNA formyltransferase
MNIVFFGSTSDSVLVLKKLPAVRAVVTQPPKPVGRKQIITPTPVEMWATKHDIPTTTLDVITPFTPDLLVSASYGEKIPFVNIKNSTYGGLNVHPSILPRWRGADPVPWAIITGDHQIGVTVVTLSEQFDRGKIIAQKKKPITQKDFSVALRTKLFAMGADLLANSLDDYLSGKNTGVAQKTGNEPYARRLTRDDGFEPWEHLIDPSQALRINRKFRAFHPWPGLWTRLPSLRSGVGGQATFSEKRLKILSFEATPLIVQLEGKKPVPWKQFNTAYLAS